ncbi:MAG: hypothetical protein WCP12_16980, partial [bacterium]
MKIRFFDNRYLVYFCVCAAGLTGLIAHADTSGGAPRSRKLTLGELCERIDRAIKASETNENARKYPDVRSDIFLSATQRLEEIEKLGDRAALPFLEEKSLMINAPSSFRFRAAETYAKLATAEECATFLPKILKIDDVDKTIISWRYRVTPMCLNKIEAAIAMRELSNATVHRLVDAFVTYTQSAYYSNEAALIDNFLLKHC